MKRYTILLLLAALLFAGCQQTDVTDSMPDKSEYTTRVTFLVSLSVGDMSVETTPMSRTANLVATDLWYAVFDGTTGTLVPAQDGRTIRHLTLTDGAVPAFEEILPTGTYKLSFLAMTEGGDREAVLSPKQWTDSWLTASTDGTVAGDFLTAQTVVDLQPEVDNRVKIELQRAVAQFRLNIAFSDAIQANSVRSVMLSMTEGELFTSLGADGTYDGSATIANLDMTDARTCFLLASAPDDQPHYKGNVLLTIAESGGKEYLRAYPFTLELKAGERTSFNLTLNLAYDALDVLTLSDKTSEIRMFDNSEAVSTMQNEERRAFYANTPLRVAKKDEQSNYIQFYSTKGIGHTEIYARIKSTEEYFKVYELDTIPPFSELVMPNKLLSGKTFTSVTQEGKIVHVPTKGLAWDHFEYLCVNKTSEYWQRYGNGVAKPTWKFRIYGIDQMNIKDYDNEKHFMNVTHDIARKMVAMSLNWAHMFSTERFREALEVGGPYHIDVKDSEVPAAIKRITSTPDDMFNRILEVSICTYILQRPGAGVLGQGGAGIGMVCIPEGQYINQIPTDHDGYWEQFVKFHEFAHVMGFPDNYGVNGVNTITNYGDDGWPKVCDYIMLELATQKDLPVTTLKELDEIFN